MAITHTEDFASPTNVTSELDDSKNTRDYEYTLFTTAEETEDDLIVYLEANTPLTVDDDNLVRTRIKLNRDDEADDLWRGVVTYTRPQGGTQQPPPVPGGTYRWSVRSTGGGTVKTLLSLGLQTEAVDPAFQAKWQHLGNGTSAEIANLLGWKLTPEGGTNAEGYDLEAGAVEVVVELAVTAAQVSAGFIVSVAGYAASKAVNLNLWNGFAAKTLRFTNYTAIPRGAGADADWDLTYTFNFNPSETVTLQNLSVAKQGQHLLEVITEHKEVDATDGFVLPNIIALKTHQIYPEIDYSSSLGI